MIAAGLVLVLAAAAFVADLVLENGGHVSINLLGWSFTTRVWVVALSGVVAMAVLILGVQLVARGVPLHRRRRRELREIAARSRALTGPALVPSGQPAPRRFPGGMPTADSVPVPGEDARETTGPASPRATDVAAHATRPGTAPAASAVAPASRPAPAASVEPLPRERAESGASSQSTRAWWRPRHQDGQPEPPEPSSGPVAGGTGAAGSDGPGQSG